MSEPQDAEAPSVYATWGRLDLCLSRTTPRIYIRLFVLSTPLCPNKWTNTHPHALLSFLSLLHCIRMLFVGGCVFCPWSVQGQGRSAICSQNSFWSNWPLIWWGSLSPHNLPRLCLFCCSHQIHLMLHIFHDGNYLDGKTTYSFNFCCCYCVFVWCPSKGTNNGTPQPNHHGISRTLGRCRAMGWWHCCCWPTYGESRQSCYKPIAGGVEVGAQFR